MNRKAFALGMLAMFVCVSLMAAVNGIFANVNATVGYQFNGAAPSNHILLGNGSQYVDATTLPSAAFPAVGTAGTYVYPASVTTDAQGRITAITAGHGIAATVSFSSCTLASDGGSQWDCSSSNSWGTTLPNSTYQVSCSLGDGNFSVPSHGPIQIFISSKSTTSVNYILVGNNSGDNGWNTSIDCTAVE